jgi:hypothetical protein
MRSRRAKTSVSASGIFIAATLSLTNALVKGLIWTTTLAKRNEATNTALTCVVILRIESGPSP